MYCPFLWLFRQLTDCAVGVIFRDMRDLRKLQMLSRRMAGQYLVARQYMHYIIIVNHLLAASKYMTFALLNYRTPTRMWFRNIVS